MVLRPNDKRRKVGINPKRSRSSWLYSTQIFSWFFDRKSFSFDSCFTHRSYSHLNKIYVQIKSDARFTNFCNQLDNLIYSEKRASIYFCINVLRKITIASKWYFWFNIEFALFKFLLKVNKKWYSKTSHIRAN